MDIATLERNEELADQLMKICQVGNAIRKAISLIQEAPGIVNSRDYDLSTPLHIASAHGELSVVGLLINQGALIDPMDNELNTPLHYAAKNNQTKIAEYLVKKKSNIHQTNLYGETALHIACEYTNSDVAFLLLKSGANFNQQDIHGITPFKTTAPQFYTRFIKELFHLAFHDKSIDIIKELMVLQTEKGIVNLSGMEIRHFPDEGVVAFEACGGECLDLSNNLLTSLPCTLRKSDVKIDGNSLSLIPESARGSWAKIRTYLDSVSDRATRWSECKLLLVGQEGVGKTTLLNALKSKSGKVNCKNNISTDGVNIQEGISMGTGMSVASTGSNVKDKRASIWRSTTKKKKIEISYNCWDLGGQEVFYPTHQFFLTSNSIYLLVFNAVAHESARIDYWMRQIKALTNNSNKAPVILVGTHCDHPDFTPEKQSKLVSLLHKTFPKCRFRGMQGIMFISSKSGIGVQELKAKISSVSYCKEFRPVVSQSWVRLHDYLKSKKKLLDIVDWKTYEEWAQIAGIPSGKALDLATEFFCGVGSLIHFSDKNEKLNNLVILNPQWLADVMASLITFNHTWAKDGVLSVSKIPQIFKKFPTDLHESLLILLEKFGIINRLSPQSCSLITEEQIIVSSMLPEERPADLDKEWSSILSNDSIQQGRKYKFPFLPLGFFNRIMVRLLHIPNLKGLLFWRNGIVISYGGQHALLEYYPKSVECSITVRTPCKRITNKYSRNLLEIDRAYDLKDILLLRILVNCVDTLIESYRMSPVQRLIPCSHCYLRDINMEPFYFTFDECAEAITNGISIMYCEHIKRKNMAIAIEQLAPDIAFADIPLINYADLTFADELGRGAFGVVYLAELFGTKVAVKQLTSLSMNEESFSDFQQEVYIMSQLNSNYLVKLRGVTLKPKLAMILEYLPMGDLYQFLHPGQSVTEIESKVDKGDFPWKLRLMIAYDIARGLQYLQKQTPPIAHRDLRSPNIFLANFDVDSPVRAKVADFGLARTIAPYVQGTLNTWQWIAPEAISEGQFDCRSDIYSLAVVFYEIASRSYPFDEFIYNPEYSVDLPSGDLVLDQVKIKTAIIEKSLRPTLPGPEEGAPDAFLELIESCWDGEPEKRPDIDKIVETLVAIIEEFDTLSTNGSYLVSQSSSSYEGVLSSENELMTNSPIREDLIEEQIEQQLQEVEDDEIIDEKINHLLSSVTKEPQTSKTNEPDAEINPNDRFAAVMNDQVLEVAEDDNKNVTRINLDSLDNIKAPELVEESAPDPKLDSSHAIKRKKEKQKKIDSHQSSRIHELVPPHSSSRRNSEPSYEIPAALAGHFNSASPTSSNDTSPSYSPLHSPRSPGDVNSAVSPSSVPTTSPSAQTSASPRSDENELAKLMVLKKPKIKKLKTENTIKYSHSAGEERIRFSKESKSAGQLTLGRASPLSPPTSSRKKKNKQPSSAIVASTEKSSPTSKRPRRNTMDVSNSNHFPDADLADISSKSMRRQTSTNSIKSDVPSLPTPILTPQLIISSPTQRETMDHAESPSNEENSSNQSPISLAPIPSPRSTPSLVTTSPRNTHIKSNVKQNSPPVSRKNKIRKSEGSDPERVEKPLGYLAERLEQLQKEDNEKSKQSEKELNSHTERIETNTKPTSKLRSGKSVPALSGSPMQSILNQPPSNSISPEPSNQGKNKLEKLIQSDFCLPLSEIHQRNNPPPEDPTRPQSSRSSQDEAEKTNKNKIKSPRGQKRNSIIRLKESKEKTTKKRRKSKTDKEPSGNEGLSISKYNQMRIGGGNSKISCLTLGYNDRLWIGMDDGTVLVYTKDFLLLSEWTAHESSVLALAFVKTRILRDDSIWSTSTDGMLRVWSSDFILKQEWKPFTFKCKLNLVLSTSFQKYSKIFVTSSFESDITVWDSDTCNLLHNIKLENKQKVSCLTQVGSSVWIGSYSGSIQIFSIASANQLLSWKPHAQSVVNILNISDQIWTIDSGGTIFIWHFNDAKIDKVATYELNYPINSMKYIPCISQVWQFSDRITIWDCNTSKPLNNLKELESKDQISFIDSRNNCIVTLSDNSLITIWEPK